MFALKALSLEGIAGALKKAERHRFLDEPAQAESICLDILDIDPDNQEARVGLVLSLTDQIPVDKRAFHKAMAAATHLQSAHDRAYYLGIAWERRALALYQECSKGTCHSVYEWTVKALHCFEEAEHLRAPGSDEALLRWNSCVRFLRQHPELSPHEQEVPEAIVSE